MNRRVLFVDDEVHLLAGICRVLRNVFDIHVAASGAEGLAKLSASPPFAVVVSDLRMPGMDGVEFLAHARSSAPQTVRVMLTGQADLERAMAAVNEGNIFRFLAKPCVSDTLIKTLNAACEQYDLIVAEQEVLEKTLAGAVELLIEVLGMVNPVAFGRAARIRPIVAQLTAALNWPDPWRFDIAAMLCQLGCVALPPEVLGRHVAGQPLEEDEAALVAAHPETGARLLARIPRFESVARIVAAQRRECAINAADDCERQGGAALRVALALDDLLLAGNRAAQAIARVKQQMPDLSPVIRAALDQLQLEPPPMRLRAIALRELTTAMILDEDLRAHNGVTLVPRGQAVTPAALERLRAFSRGIGVIEPFRVREPEAGERPAGLINAGSR